MCCGEGTAHLLELLPLQTSCLVTSRMQGAWVDIAIEPPSNIEEVRWPLSLRALSKKGGASLLTVPAAPSGKPVLGRV